MGISSLECKVNEWLARNSEFEILQKDVTQSSNHNGTHLHITIWYNEKKKES
ncbi:MAG: hypothetical protein M0R51_01915 [Clostridia bacterium]|nr:hypothetical protein [Clostridia bacterium]